MDWTVDWNMDSILGSFSVAFTYGMCHMIAFSLQLKLHAYIYVAYLVPSTKTLAMGSPVLFLAATLENESRISSYSSPLSSSIFVPLSASFIVMSNTRYLIHHAKEIVVTILS